MNSALWTLNTINLLYKESSLGQVRPLTGFMSANPEIMKFANWVIISQSLRSATTLIGLEQIVFGISGILSLLVYI
jgi:hypothetical protein